MKRAERQPVGDLTLYAGIYVKRWTVLDAGMVLPQHAHQHDHITYLVSGSIRVWRGDLLVGDHFAPGALKIPARQPHTFQALENNVVLLCIHNADHLDAGEPPVHAEHTFRED